MRVMRQDRLEDDLGSRIFKALHVLLQDLYTHVNPRSMARKLVVAEWLDKTKELGSRATITISILHKLFAHLKRILIIAKRLGCPPASVSWNLIEEDDPCQVRQILRLGDLSPKFFPLPKCMLLFHQRQEHPSHLIIPRPTKVPHLCPPTQIARVAQAFPRVQHFIAKPKCQNGLQVRLSTHAASMCQSMRKRRKL